MLMAFGLVFSRCIFSSRTIDRIESKIPSRLQHRLVVMGQRLFVVEWMALRIPFLSGLEDDGKYLPVVATWECRIPSIGIVSANGVRAGFDCGDWANC